MLKALLRSLGGQLRSGTRAGRQRPDAGEAAIARAREALKAGDLAAADAALDAVAAEGRAQPAFLSALGDLRLAQKRHGEAVAAFRGALATNLRHTDAYAGLGLALFETGELEAAYEQFQLVNQVRPRDPDNLCHMGLVNLALGNLQPAEKQLRAAVNLDASHAHAWNNLGVCLKRRGMGREALGCFRRAAEANPALFWPQSNLGLSLWEHEDPAGALRHLERAVALRPERAQGHINLAVVLKTQGDWARAEVHLAKALELEPRNVDAWVARAALADDAGHLEEAEKLYREALAIAPDDPEANTGLAEVFLAQGRFAEGWPLYENRLRSRESPRRPYAYPLWDGAAPQGKTLLVYEEQGLGDTILFASCLPELLQRGAHCVLACNSRLEKLFARSFPAVRVVNDAQASRLPGIDACVPIGSLMRHYRGAAEAFPAHRGYLAADAGLAQVWRERLSALGEGLRVGLVWRGGLAKTGRALRSVPLHELQPLLQQPGIRWVSLQHGLAEDEREALRSGEPRIAHWEEAVRDFDQLAALAVNLDLVISVCSSAVHLGGALGRPVWVLAPQAPSWRYLRSGASLPWYPSVRVLRAGPGGWPALIKEVARDLASWSGGSASEAATALPLQPAALGPSAPSDPAARALPAGSDLQALRTMLHEGRAAEALAALEEAHNRAPEEAEPAWLLAACLAALNRLEESLDTLALLLHHHPEHAEGHTLSATLAYKRGDAGAAVAAFQRALAAKADHLPAILGLVTALDREGRWDEMLQWTERAMAQAPEVSDVQLMHGLALSRAERTAEAVQFLEQGMASARGFQGNSHLTLGAAYYFLGRTREALEQYERVLQREPNNFQARYFRAHARLALGDYEGGWDDYEYRVASQAGETRPFPYPRWRGEPLEGKAVLLYSEQGLGDEMMFASCFHEVIERARLTVIECDGRLEKLFRRSFPSARVFAGRRELLPKWFGELPPIDYQVFSGGLPGRFRRRVEQFPDRSSYLVADAESVQAWRERLAGLGPGIKVGVSWRGGTTKTRTRTRSLALDDLLPVLSVPQAQFVSLQYGEVAAELAEFRARRGVALHHWQEAIDDYDQTAALCGALDVVVTVCTAIVHLSGALGRPALVLTPQVPEWRYGRQGERMPWYPSVRLIRQEIQGDWRPVLEETRRRLLRLRSGAEGAGD